MNPNHRRVTEGLHVLTGVLAPYVARELRAKLADEWWPRGVFDVLYESQRRDLPAGGGRRADRPARPRPLPRVWQARWVRQAPRA